MARYGCLLTDAQWEKIRPLLPKRPRRPQGGRPPANDRKVLEGILWILRSGARWCDLPDEFPFSGHVLEAAARLGRARRMAHHLASIPGRTEPTQAVGLERIVSGRQFRSGQKRGCKVGKTKRGKGTKWMVVVDGQGIPLGEQLYSASPNEVRLAEETLASIRVSRRHGGGRPRQKVRRVIADRAYDSDPLRAQLATRGIELIAPHRWNRSKPRTQDGRALRRYRRRWKIERTFAWLGNYRRLVRYDRSITIYDAFFHIACFMITLRRVLK